MLTMQKNLSRSFYVLLSLPSTAMGFALSIQIAALSWLLNTQYGLDIHEVGLVWAAGPIAGILGQVIIGIISDKVWFWGGRRRPFIIIGGVLAGMMLLALPNIDIVSSALGMDGLLGIAIMIALTLDLSINVSMNPTRSIIADVTPQGEQRTQGYTWMQLISGTFGMMAYAIGATLGNYVLIYLGAALVFLLAVIPPFFITEPKELTDSEDGSEKSAIGVKEILINIKPLWGFLIYDVYALFIKLAGIKTNHYWVEIACLVLTAYFVITTLIPSEQGKCEEEANRIGFRKVLAAHSFSWIGIQSMFVFLFAFLQDKMPGIGDDELGKIINLSFLVLNGVAAILPALVLLPLTRSYGLVRVHTVCIATMAMGYFGVVLFGDNEYMLYGLMAFLGIGWSAVISLAFAIMSEKIDQSRMGSYMGLFNLSVVIPQLVVSLGVGLAVSQADDKGLIFIISAVSLLISAIAWMRVGEIKPKALS
ncbi:MFS transporter [Thalassotalea litorea]|uniref:MFS transporter n=1 Tax=Thalassotalea litorea TaxID=2020715 RepID=UPI003736978F